MGPHVIRLNSASGDLLVVSLYAGTPYSSDTVRKILELAKALGMKAKFAVFYNTSPARAEPSSLHAGELETIRLNLGTSSEDWSIPNLVLADCNLEWQVADTVIEAKLRCAFCRDGTFSVNFDIPYSNVFEESPLPAKAKRFIWLSIEGLSQLSFESGDFLYGGLYWENEAPSLGDLERHERTLPVDFALYSRQVVDILGLPELRTWLRKAHAVRVLEGGGLFFAWSGSLEQPEENVVPADFREFVGRFKWLGVMGR